MRIPKDRPSIDVTPEMALEDLLEEIRSGESDIQKLVVCMYVDNGDSESVRVNSAGIDDDAAYVLLARGQGIFLAYRSFDDDDEEDENPSGGEN